MFHCFRSLLSFFCRLGPLVRPFFSLNMQHLSCIASHIEFLIFSGAFEHTSTPLKPYVKSRSKLSPLRWNWRRSRFVFQNSPSQWLHFQPWTAESNEGLVSLFFSFPSKITFNCSYSFGRKNQNWNIVSKKKWQPPNLCGRNRILKMIRNFDNDI